MNKTKRSIFESAMKVFSLYGYDSATMDTIAADAGVAKGTLYYHFKSKEEIFKYIIEQGMILIKDKIEGITNDQEDALTKLKTLCKIQLELVHEKRDFFKVIMSQLWGQELRHLELREAIKKYIYYIQTYLDESIRDGVVKQGDSYFMAYTLFGMLFSAAVYELTNEDKNNLDGLVQNLLQNILTGIQSK